jgi:CBS domain-containing protein
MKTFEQARSTSRMVRGASKAEDLMTPNPMSVRQDATVSEAASFLVGRGVSAAPVIDESGHPVGVVSNTDILIHMGQGTLNRGRSPEYRAGQELSAFTADGPGPEAAGHFKVRDIMTPGVFYVRPETPAAKVVEKMLALKVRRLFVVDRDGVLIGVVSAIDVLGKLQHSGPLGG